MIKPICKTRKRAIFIKAIILLAIGIFLSPNLIWAEPNRLSGISVSSIPATNSAPRQRMRNSTSSSVSTLRSQAATQDTNSRVNLAPAISTAISARTSSIERSNSKLNLNALKVAAPSVDNARALGSLNIGGATTAVKATDSTVATASPKVNTSNLQLNTGETRIQIPRINNTNANVGTAPKTDLKANLPAFNNRTGMNLGAAAAKKAAASNTASPKINTNNLELNANIPGVRIPRINNNNVNVSASPKTNLKANLPAINNKAGLNLGGAATAVKAANSNIASPKINTNNLNNLRTRGIEAVEQRRGAGIRAVSPRLNPPAIGTPPAPSVNQLNTNNQPAATQPNIPRPSINTPTVSEPAQPDLRSKAEANPKITLAMGNSSAPRVNLAELNIGAGGSNRRALPTGISTSPRINSANIGTPSRLNTRINRSTATPAQLDKKVNSGSPKITEPKNNHNRINNPKVALPSRLNTSQIGQSQRFNPRINTIPAINSRSRFNATAPMPSTRAPAGGKADIPVPASRQAQPVSLPPVPTSIPNSSSPGPSSGGAGSTGTGNANHSSSNSNSSGGGSSLPIGAPLMLGLCGQLPILSRKRISRIISEISRREKNGIGFILAPRAPNITQVDECFLAFVHQREEEIPQFNPRNNLRLNEYLLSQRFTSTLSVCLRKSFFYLLSFINLKSIYLPKYSFILGKVFSGLKYRFLRSQNTCGLFYYLVKTDGR